MGFEIQPAWYASINPLVIIIFAPLFALLWTKLGSRQPSILFKMSLGLWLAFFGFGLLAVAFTFTGSALVSPLWVVGGISLMTLGELMLSPTGLSAATLLAPQRHMSKMMSLWFVSNALGQGIIAVTVRFFDSAAPQNFYLAFAVVALVVGGILFATRHKLTDLAKGIR